MTLPVIARAVGNAVFLETPGGCGDVASWGEQTEELASFVAWQINAALERTVLEAARLCDSRASVEARPMSVRSEANKCADTIRHLLCQPGERICYHCDGNGCDRPRCKEGVVS